MNECQHQDDYDPSGVSETVNKWIVGEVWRTELAVREALETYRFNEAADALYHFTWHVFCDWYLEFSKPLLNGGEGPAKLETRATTSWVLEQALRLLHPMMPFITEELWQQTTGKDTLLINEAWPTPQNMDASEAASEMEWVIRLVTEIRSVRSEMNVPAGAKVPLVVKDANDLTRSRLQRHEDLIFRMARVSSLRHEQELPEGTAQIVLDEATMGLPLGDVIDFSKESERLTRELEKVRKDKSKVEAKLGDEKFMSRAPEEVISAQRERLADAEQSEQKLTEAISRLSALS